MNPILSLRVEEDETIEIRGVVKRLDGLGRAKGDPFYEEAGASHEIRRSRSLLLIILKAFKLLSLFSSLKLICV